MMAPKFNFRVLSYPNSGKVLGMDGHPERLHALLCQYPIDNCLCGFFGVVLVLLIFVDRKRNAN